MRHVNYTLRPLTTDNAKPREKPYALTDGGGLLLERGESPAKSEQSTAAAQKLAYERRVTFRFFAQQRRNALLSLSRLCRADRERGLNSGAQKPDRPCTGKSIRPCAASA
jgi:hypothetical protein